MPRTSRACAVISPRCSGILSRRGRVSRTGVCSITARAQPQPHQRLKLTGAAIRVTRAGAGCHTAWLTTARPPRAMYQGFVERGFSHTESQTARFAAVLGRALGTYSSYTEELMQQWAS